MWTVALVNLRGWNSTGSCLSSMRNTYKVCTTSSNFDNYSLHYSNKPTTFILEVIQYLSVKKTATIRDKSSWHTCLKRVLLTNIKFIYYIILSKRRKSPHPPNQCCLKYEKRLEDPKFNIDFGWGRQGKGISISTMPKRGHFIEVCQHFCPSLSESKIVLLHTSWPVYDPDFNWH